MKNIVLLSAILALSSAPAFAFDSDPGYGRHAYYPAGALKPNRTTYYKPTMRYFGKGYTVTYRFVPWDANANRAGLTGYEGQQYQLPAAAVQTVIGNAPRVTYYSPAPRPQSPAVAPETRVVGGAKELPAIGERIRK